MEISSSIPLIPDHLNPYERSYAFNELPSEILDEIITYLWTSTPSLGLSREWYNPNLNLVNDPRDNYLSLLDPSDIEIDSTYIKGYSSSNDDVNNTSLFRHHIFSPEGPLFLLSLTCKYFYFRVGPMVKNRIWIHKTLGEYAAYNMKPSILIDFNLNQSTNNYPLTCETLVASAIGTGNTDRKIELFECLILGGCPHDPYILLNIAMHGNLEIFSQLAAS